MPGSRVHKNNVATRSRLKHATLPVARKATNAGLAGRRGRHRLSEALPAALIQGRNVFQHKHLHDVLPKLAAQICVRNQ